MSEVGIAFGADGRLWTLGRREDGDETGFGSNGRVAVRTTTHVGSAERERLNRYDSPHLFRHGDEIYVIARRDIGVPYDPARHVSRLNTEYRRGRVGVLKVRTGVPHVRHGEFALQFQSLMN